MKKKIQTRHFTVLKKTNVLQLRLMFLGTGLIIDAFGELRDQQEQVKEDMEVRVQQQNRRALHA